MDAWVTPESSQGEKQRNTATIVSGIDVIKAVLNVHADGDERSFDKNGISFRALAKCSRQHTVEPVATEMTDRFHRDSHQLLHDRSFEFVINTLYSATSAKHLDIWAFPTTLTRMCTTFRQAFSDLVPTAG